MLRRCFYPLASRFEHVLLAIAKKHHIQHRIVRDQYVGWVKLHVPARSHLSTVETRNKEALEVAIWQRLDAGLYGRLKGCGVKLLRLRGPGRGSCEVHAQVLQSGGRPHTSRDR